MDPVACLDLAYQHYEEGDIQEARYDLQNYTRWVKMGGFFNEELSRRADDIAFKLTRPHCQ